MRTLLLAAVLATLPAPAALACKVEANYRAPTNFALVEAADLVVLGKVEELGKNDPGHFTQVAIKPIKTYKGKAPGGAILVRGTSTAAPNATPLDKAHPSVMYGTCTRSAFARKSLVIAMFRQTPDGYKPLDFPFARTIEDVESRLSLWVRAIEVYAPLAQVPEAERRAAVEAEVKRLDADLDDRTASLAIAKDLRAWLSATRVR